MLPNLARLTTSTCVPGNSAVPPAAPLTQLPTDLVVKILTDNADAKAICAAVVRWCSLYKTACDEKLWESAARLFGVTPDIVYIFVSRTISPQDFASWTITWREIFVKLCTQLHQMPAELRGVLLQGADVNNVDENGNTALMLASKNNYREIVVMLLDRDAEVDAANNIGNTALLLASREGHDEIVHELLDRNADASIDNDDQNTALLLASREGHIGVVEYLLDGHAYLKLMANKNGDTALILASGNGHTDIVNELLTTNDNIGEATANAYVDEVNNDGLTALMKASRWGHAAIVTALLAAGANPNMANNSDTTALTMARFNGHTEIVAMLRDAAMRMRDEEEENDDDTSSEDEEPPYMGPDGDEFLAMVL